MNKIRNIVIAVIVALGALAIPAVSSAHDTVSVHGTVTCSGAYSIGVRADIWDDIRLIVTLRGAKIIDRAIPGNDQTVREFGPFTGTGAHAGDAITAYTSDSTHVVTGALVLIGSPCRQHHYNPTPPHIQWLGPCGDPMHGVRLWAGSRNTRFIWTRSDNGNPVTKVTYVLRGKSKFTGWKHVDGGTMMVVTARGKLWTRVAAKAGNYRACR